MFFLTIRSVTALIMRHGGWNVERQQFLSIQDYKSTPPIFREDNGRIVASQYKQVSQLSQ